VSPVGPRGPSLHRLQLDEGAILLDAELASGLADFPLEAVDITIDDLIDPGLSIRESRIALAELLAGTTNKSSRAYKSAYRQAERWMVVPGSGRKPRQPTLPSRLRLRAARKQMNERLANYRQYGAFMRVLIVWYQGSKEQWIPPHHYLKISREVMRRVIRTWAADERQEAWDDLWEQFLIRYKVPNIEDWLKDVQVVELDIRPGNREPSRPGYL
jgi:hypothetical protein